MRIRQIIKLKYLRMRAEYLASEDFCSPRLMFSLYKVSGVIYIIYKYNIRFCECGILKFRNCGSLNLWIFPLFQIVSFH